ncbi:MAG: LPS export ABC transporter periplasmic protein LptC [Desulfobacterales bacterium]|nr:LPS export ABC transporter periplasmic protein LptC [Desulfobacterales bacterium]
MFLLKYNNPKNLKILLLFTIIVTCVIILSVFINYRHILNKPGNIIPSIQKGVNISINQLRHTATRNGMTEWSLEAKSAQLIDSKKEAFLQNISLTFFLDNGEKIYLTANQGVLKTDSNDIEVSGNIMIKNNKYRLKTENLHYEYGRRIIFTNAPVEIFGVSFNLMADSMVFNFNTNKILLEGSVNGNFSKNIKL